MANCPKCAKPISDADVMSGRCPHCHSLWTWFEKPASQPEPKTEGAPSSETNTISVICPHCNRVNQIPANTPFNQQFECPYCSKTWVFIDHEQRQHTSETKEKVIGGISGVLIFGLILLGVFIWDRIENGPYKSNESSSAEKGESPRSDKKLTTDEHPKTFGEKTSEIRAGMSKDKVEELLGRPDIADTAGQRLDGKFHDDLEWYYLIEDKVTYKKQQYVVVFVIQNGQYVVKTAFVSPGT